MSRARAERLHALYLSDGSLTLDDVGAAQDPPCTGSNIGKAFLRFGLPARKRGARTSATARAKAEALYDLYSTGKTLAQVGACQDPPRFGTWIGYLFAKYRRLDGGGWETRRPSGPRTEAERARARAT